MKKNNFILFANCIPVKGACQSTICDLQLSRLVIIPNFVFSFLSKSREINLDEAKIIFGENFKEIENYIEFLEKEGWGFWCENPALFPEILLEWDSPSEITNCIIDINKESKYNFEKLFQELEELGCEAIQIRSYNYLKMDELEYILSQTQTSRICSIELLLEYSHEITELDVISLVKTNPRIKSIVFHSSPSPKHKIELVEYSATIIWTEFVISSDSHCGIVSSDFFAINLPLFSESKNYNSCLNRKIGIDVKGNIKNCPSMTESYGNINFDSLSSVLSKSGFKKVWNITKDQISICKDCEFRYVCTDCREFITDKSDNFSKPAKCTYDPYSPHLGKNIILSR